MEVCFNDTWVTVNGNGWDIAEAQVVCRQLGFSRAVIREEPTVLYNASFGEGNGPIYLDGVTCSGNETKLFDCSFKTLQHANGCDHSEDVGVRCHGTIYSYNIILGFFRLCLT